MEEEPSIFFFPIRNEQGFKVESPEHYWHLIGVIATAQTELAEEYPDHTCVVYFECHED